MPTYVSVFAGRIADTGVDPLPLMKEAVKVTHSKNWMIMGKLPRIIQCDSS